ncbi:astacin [Teladorsagia circumcincta]|uniref:Astacin n=1 Tax=Teladorsagia circumcincta TaxID=45464 RepID=A0A2G9TMA2_TELCI|nr:astacin [Teladorsagia circumcincta]
MLLTYLQLFENTALFKIRDKIRSMKEKVLKTLELSPAMMKSLQERLKKLRPIKNDKVQEIGDTITEVNENSQVDQYLYQGDVVLTEEQADEIVEDIEDEVVGGNRTKRQAFKDHRYPKMLWSQGVNYYFHNLASMHASKIPNKQETTKTNDNYGMTYDYGSIMHYGGTSASFNKKPTMVPFDVDYQQTLGSPFISFIELSMLNEHYKCKENCNPSKSAKCEMGGFPHPRDCSKCICPGGYAGDRCTERPSGCGSTIQASPDWERLQDTLGSGECAKDDIISVCYNSCFYYYDYNKET